MKSMNSSSSISGGSAGVEKIAEKKYPSSYIYHRNLIIKIAIVTRIFIWLCSILATHVLTDFDSSTSLNSISPIQQSTSPSTSAQQIETLLDHSGNAFIEKYLFRVFVKWDSVYYLRIAEYGYEYEQYHAFFPLLPLLLRYLATGLSFITFNYLNNFKDYIIISGFIISHLSFILSSIQLLKLSYILFNRDQKISFISTVLYTINPASIFMSAIYTESTFNFFTFAGLYYLYGGRFYLNSNRSMTIDKMPMGRKILSSTIGSIFFALATASRSNGMLLAGFTVFYHFQSEFITIFRRLFIILNKLTQKKRSSPILTHSSSIGSYLNRVNSTSSSSSNSNSSSSLLQKILGFKLKIIVIVVQVLVNVSPYLLFQYYGYQLYCTPSHITIAGGGVDKHVLHPQDYEDKVGQWPRPWCLSEHPNLYAFVQERYWNQGFFNYYTIQQIPNFLLASPMVILATCSVISYLMHFIKNPYQLSINPNIPNKRSIGGNSNGSGQSTSYNLYQTPFILPFVVHLGFLVLFSTTFMHVQVITRFFTHSPLIFWYSSTFFNNNNDSKAGVGGDFKSKLVLGYYLLYNILGCVLFTNFYPWT